MIKITSFGAQLRSLRESQSLTLKNVAEQIEIDTSLLAKIERNERSPNKHIIKKIAIFFGCNEQELLGNFLSDQIANKILKEEADIELLKVAEAKVKYLKSIKNAK